MIPSRRRSSTKVFIIPRGTWSVKEGGKFMAEGISESDAWKIYLATINNAQLICSGVVMSERGGLKVGASDENPEKG